MKNYSCLSIKKFSKSFLYVWYSVFGMAEDNKVYIPASSGGVVTYYKDSESKIKIDPNYIVVFIVIVLILEFILHQSKVFLS